MESTKRCRLAKLRARGRSVEAWALRRAQQVAQGDHFSRPHFHPNDRFITVLNGTWWMGSGATFDPDNSVPLPAGTFVTHFGKQVHWDGAKAEDASLLIFGDGPGTSTQVEFAAGRF